VIEFEVIGVPKPQGSMKAFNVGGHARVKPSGGSDFAAWRNAVSQAARDVRGHDDVLAPLDGPLALVVTFRFPMPKSRPKAAQKAGEAWKTSAPDTDKLVRTIGDALTAANLVTDDARFAVINATKVETTGWTGAVIRVERLAA
jgi:Holliday junction resolvase RusA-like endonuclease